MRRITEMKMIRILLCFILVCFGSLVSAQDFQKGLEAAKVGDYQTALQEWRPLAEQGAADAQHNLGMMYYNGYGVVQDYQEAVKWYRLSAEQGAATAQDGLGVMYHNGYGVVQDYVYAHMWFNIAASLGSEAARKNRDSVQKVMSTEQISEAQKLAKECVRKNYKNCD